jgi:hypothetical protein
MAKQLQPEDPFEMVAVGLPTTEDRTDEMARTFVEEFALMGLTAERIMRLFEHPFYAGAHMVYQSRGEEFVRGLIDEVFGSGEAH